MPRRPQTALVNLKIRMKEPLRKKLEVAAKGRGVSLNAEAVARLERSFERESWLQEFTQIFQSLLNQSAGEVEGLIARVAKLEKQRG